MSKTSRLKQYITLFSIIQLAHKASCVDVYSTPHDFCYSDSSCGPDSDKWGGKCHTGTRQSPLNLIRNTKVHPRGKLISHPNLTCDSFFIQNNGHTINLNFHITGNGFFPGYGLSTTKYAFANLHFHWGKDDTVGSEHMIDGKSSSMELHFVHYNRKYKSVSDAVESGDPDALAVVAFLLQVSSSAKPSQALAPVVQNLEKVHDTHGWWEKVDEGLDLSSLLPIRGELFFSYKGSLTTPDCNEQVNWYVFTSPKKICSSDVAAFRTIQDADGQPLLENSRPVQKEMNRQIDTWTSYCIRL